MRVCTYDEIFDLARWYPKDLERMHRALKNRSMTRASASMAQKLYYIRKFADARDTSNAWTTTWTRVVLDHANDYKRHYMYPPFLLRDLRAQRWWMVLSAVEYLPL